MRAQILGGKVGDAVSDCGEGGNHHIVQLYGGGIASHDRRAEAVYYALDQNIADGDKTLL